MILAIDPGPKESAYTRWNGERVLAHATLENCLMLDIINANPMHEIAIEWITFYGNFSGATVHHTCRWVGRFEQAAGCSEDDGHLVSRDDVRLHLCGTKRAGDQHVRQALIDRLGQPGKKKTPGPTYGISGHEWSALAVAVTYWDKRAK